MFRLATAPGTASSGYSNPQPDPIMSLHINIRPTDPVGV